MNRNNTNIAMTSLILMLVGAAYLAAWNSTVEQNTRRAYQEATQNGFIATESAARSVIQGGLRLSKLDPILNDTAVTLRILTPGVESRHAWYLATMKELANGTVLDTKPRPRPWERYREQAEQYLFAAPEHIDYHLFAELVLRDHAQAINREIAAEARIRAPLSL